ncbi:ABC transporter permease [Staphylococcus sp. GDX8P65P]|uniref:ABC transporter permease n=1 Tax=Staphylococcus sp. GDX8P65P TaxID=2804101 RepID=UPI001AEC2D79|nr:ABC transporter permease [Staphylococcus sp. GDX8P65P]
MNKFLTSFNYTYTNKLKSISFIITTTILILLIISAFNADKIIDLFNEDKKIGIITNKHAIYDSLKKNKSFNTDDNKIVKLHEKEAKKKIKNNDLDYALKLSFDKRKLYSDVFSKSELSDTDSEKIESTLNNLQMSLNMISLKLSKEEIKELSFKPKINKHIVNNTKYEGKLGSKEKDFQLVFTYIIITIMFFVMLTYVNHMAMEIATEKTSRVIETIITSITPKIHIISKICSIIALALTQIAILLITATICYFIFDTNKVFDEIGFEVSSKSIPLITFNLIFWCIGIFSYITLSSLFGSLTSRIEEVGQAITPLIFIMLGGFYIAIFNLKNSENILVEISSYIPLLSPFTMPLRIAGNSVEMNSILISIMINILFIIVVFITVTKTFKKSILSFDKGILKKLRISKGG